VTTTNQPLGQGVTGLSLDLLAERISHERELRETTLAHERELRLLTEEHVRDNLRTQAAEYARRLDELNHAHAQAVEAQARTVPRELYEAFVKENDTRRETLLSSVRTQIGSLDDAIGVERQARIRAEGALSTWRFIAATLGASGIVGIILGAIAVFGPQ
jgi:hypothetical protein